MTERIHDSVLDLVGRTPLVRLRHVPAGAAEVVVKLESYHPARWEVACLA